MGFLKFAPKIFEIGKGAARDVGRAVGGKPIGNIQKSGLIRREKGFSGGESSKPKLDSKKNGSKPVSQKIDNSAFAKKLYYTREQADWWLAQELNKTENRMLLDSLLRYNRPKSGETRLQWVKRINNEVFGNVKDPAYPQKAAPLGSVLEKDADKYKFLLREKFLKEEYRKKTEKGDYMGAKKIKLGEDLLSRFTGNGKE